MRTDFVVLAGHISPQLSGWIESKLEGWLGLQINREKTRVLDLRQAARAWIFWATPFGMTSTSMDEDRRYLNLQPSSKAMARERSVATTHQSAAEPYPLPELIDD